MLLLLSLGHGFEGLRPGSTWTYWDGGALSGSPAWYELAYDDSTWAEGAAPLGYGTPVETTMAAHGGITWYARTWFEVADASAVSELLLDLEVDDGAVVWINGAEAGRWNMPSGTVSATTRATTATLAPTLWADQSVSPALLVDGPNLVAVEVHQRSATSSDIFVDLGLSADPHVVGGPWLVHAADDEVTIAWESREADAGTVSWGATAAYGNLASDSVSDTVHFVTLTGLAADTTYHYAVSADGWTTGDHSFTTLPSASADVLTLALYGDSRTQPGVHLAIAEQIAAAAPDLVMHSGDLVDEPEDPACWGRQVFDPMAPFLSSTPVFLVPGNHETEFSYPSSPYWDYFPAPGATSWWSTVAGPVRLIFLDSNDPDYADGDPTDSAQWAWLEAELAAAMEPWVVVTQHHPVYSSGWHATDVSVQGFEAWLGPLLESYGVTAFVAGHDHRYERSLAGGTHYLTLGGGGASFHPACSSSTAGVCTNPYQQAVAESYGWGLLTVDGGDLWLEVWDEEGNPIEAPVLLVDGAAGVAPTVSVSGPDGVCDTVDAELQVDAVVADPDSDADVEVGADTDGSGCDGTVLADGLVEADGAESWTVDTSGLAGGEWFVYVRADDGDSVTCTYAPGSVRVSHPTTAGTTLIELGSTWSYSATGAIPATNWFRPTYSVSSWSTGCGELGYGDGDEEVTLPSTVTTAYFRRTFTWSGATPSALWIEAAIDDGAVVYLNGREVRRVRMASGTVSYATWANANGEGSPLTVSSLNSSAPGWLVSGTNTLAVEVHQRSASSSDLSFDLRLVSVP